MTTEGTDMDRQTGVGAILCAAHKDRLTGNLHGHTYEVTAWFPAGRDALALQKMLEIAVQSFDHTVLDDIVPDTTGEHIATCICNLLIDCIEVEVCRPLERIYARAQRR